MDEEEAFEPEEPIEPAGDLGTSNFADTSDAFGEFIRSAFPTQEWDTNKLEAFKSAIKECVNADSAGEYDEGAEDEELLAILGEPEKKK